MNRAEEIKKIINEQIKEEKKLKADYEASLYKIQNEYRKRIWESLDEHMKDIENEVCNPGEARLITQENRLDEGTRIYPSVLLKNKNLLFKPYVLTERDASKVIIPIKVFEPISERAVIHITYIGIVSSGSEGDFDYVIKEIRLGQFYGNFQLLSKKERYSIMTEQVSPFDHLTEGSKNGYLLTLTDCEELYKDAEKFKEQYGDMAKGAKV